MKFRRRWVVLLLGLLVPIIVAAVFKIAGPPKKTIAPQIAREKPVMTVIVKPDSFAGGVDALGEAAPVREAVLSAEATGRVVMIREEGEKIKKGEIVARLDAGFAAASAEAAEARAGALRAEAAQVRRDLARFERLASEGAVAITEAERARTGLEAAEASARAAAMDARASRAALGNLLIRSPFAGTVLRSNVEEGEVVSPGFVIASVGDLSEMEVTVNVTEADAVHIRAGAPAIVRFDALPGETYTAVVRHVDAAVSNAARTARVILKFPSTAPANIPSGALARAMIVTEDRAGVISVPRNAVRRGPDGAAVWIVENGPAGLRIARLRRVTIGSIAQDALEIVSGLDGGEHVVIRGGEALVEGDSVQATLAP